MFGRKKLLWEDDRGAVLAYTAILMPIFLGFLALGLDIAAWHIEKRQSQTMADAAAVAAGAEYVKNQGADLTEDELAEIYTAAALATAQRNGYDADAGHEMVVNSPPSMGESEGVEDAIEVIVRAPLPVFLAGLVNVEEGGFAGSRAVVAPSGAGFTGGCVYALNSDAAGAITVSGNAEVTLGCAAYSNSVSDESIIENGANACITATDIFIVGDTDASCFTPDATTGAPSISDPLGTLPEPENADDDCEFNNTRFNGLTGGDLEPGVYCGGISINTSANVHFNAGVYILKTGGLSINGTANVTSDGITIFIPASNTSTITINGGANVNLVASADGDYQGILIYTSRDHDPEDDIEHRFNGGANMDLEGIVYTPSQDLQFTGNNAADSAGTALIADEVTFSGTSDFVAIDDSDIITNPYLGAGGGTMSLVE